MLRSEGFFGFKDNNLSSFLKLDIQSKSHTFNKAVIAAYYNVKKYGFVGTSQYIRIDQNKRSVFLIFDPKGIEPLLMGFKKPLVALCELPIFKKKTKEVCYDLHELFSGGGSAIARGLKFQSRPEVMIVDYKKDTNLDVIYNGWKQTKESDGKTFLMTFNPARYYRSYELLDYGYSIYQKVVLIKNQPYALINFSLHGEMAYELSFLSLYKNQDLKLINDQNDCIIVHCLGELYARGIKYVNLGTDAGIKGLKLFKHKHPSFEQIVYSQ